MRFETKLFIVRITISKKLLLRPFVAQFWIFRGKISQNGIYLEKDIYFIVSVEETFLVLIILIASLNQNTNV